MRRFMDEDRFEVYALRDIAVGEEITRLGNRTAVPGKSSGSKFGSSVARS